MSKNHKADSFDAGRAASILPEPDPINMRQLEGEERAASNVHPDEDDIGALLRAILALASANE